MKKFYVAFFLVLSFASTAQTYQSAAFKQKVKLLRVFLDKNHYAPLNWNDSASVLLYNRWMDLLDDDKMFFTKADIDVLKSYKTKLDDEMNGNGWVFFDKSIQLYKKAIRQADSLQKNIFSKPVDFSAPATIHYPFTTNPASVSELQQRLQKLTRWRILNGIAAELDSSAKAAANLTAIPKDFAAKEVKIRERLKRRHEINIKEQPVNDADFENEMADKYLQAISWCYDPHTEYMNLAEKKGFETALSGFEYSTGMGLDQNKDGNYEVDRLEPGGNAWRTGELHKGDIVLSIKKGNGPDRQLAEMDEDEVEQLLRGNSDEKVELTVKTAAGVTKKVTLTKEKVTDDEGIVKSYVIHGRQKVGYIQLPGFYSRESDEIEKDDDVKFDGCANDVSKEIVKLTRDTIAGLILDLRYNGGGSMWEAMQLAGIFIDYGPVGSVKNRDGKVHFLKDPNRGTAYDGPLLVLINSSSASASEMTGAMLQDYKRALIVGSTTYGKGTAQTILPMDTAYSEEVKKNYDGYKDFVKVTGGKFYRIDGTTTQWKGVIPDIALPDIYEGLGIRESKNASALLPDNAKRGMYTPLPDLPVDRLKTNSNQRVMTDTIFMNVKKAADWVKEYTTGRDIPLQWQNYITGYIKNQGMYNIMQRIEDGNEKGMAVSNNNFDKEKIKFATASGKQLNETYLKHIAADAYINEAYSIMLDWLNK
jgi:carboxyl-terminal processing protease